ncbi:MAG: phosphoribosylformylglycinamidine cyclo-ligase [Candidatus Eisenbacteria bacterium]
MRYRDAGVDVRRGDAVKRGIGEAIRRTWGAAVVPMSGGFCGVMRWPVGDRWLAATMDGVGTKLHLALEQGRVADAAADLVYHSADDLLAHGARPLAFLDYIAQARLDAGVVRDAVEGMSRACVEVGAALLGGETAQMPDTYLPGVVDVAGCMIGEVDPGMWRDGSAVVPGDRLLGLASDGLHTNGFSLARKVLSESGLEPGDPLPGGDGATVGDTLLAPHRWYGRAVLPRLADPGLHALAHITGGGLAGNLLRVLPAGARALIAARGWERPVLFRWIASAGAVPEDDMRDTFNLGIGMVLVVAPDAVERLTGALAAAGERVHAIGCVEAGERAVIWDDRGG